MDTQRQIRFGELIRSLVSDCLLKEDFYDENINPTSVTISFVKMSRDLKIANVYFMPLAGKNKLNVLDNLNEKKYIFQKYLSKAKIHSKFTPRLSFYLDDTFDEAEKIEKLLLNEKVLRDTKNE
ncbi:MAG: ribosome-binding factor A [Pelagibacteraceae bacterium TMED237]|nr:MAG: ribosome-binding factor A [Pelagibacteraceae bacterium TMED237]|tara:strand:- start:1526 stop:1897 length:372 start_codon:yes stop_codon:yes gene_type:complete